jgi:hypothetical protein
VPGARRRRAQRDEEEGEAGRHYLRCVVAADEVAGLERQDGGERIDRRRRDAHGRKFRYGELGERGLPALAAHCHRHRAHAFLEHEVRGVAAQWDLAGGHEHVGGAYRRVAGEGYLPARREDADPPGVARVRGRVDEGDLAVVELARHRQQVLLGDATGVGEDGELVATEPAVGEDVGGEEAVGGHGEWRVESGEWRYSSRLSALGEGGKLRRTSLAPSRS